jgi:hypothetical protein
MSSLFNLLKKLEDNLKTDCCSNKLTINADNHIIKLYDSINDACEENQNFAWYPFEHIVSLNDIISRETGIPCHHCDNKKCVISLRIDNHQNTRFCVVGNIEIK